MLVAARDQKVKRFVYASSSSVYGDSPDLPKKEDKIGQPLSPYALTKRVNEMYADVFARCYGVETIGLRYFNVFGPRQDPNGPYAAVIPKWIAAMKRGEPITIYGDGETSRDFCYVVNAVQANILAATTANENAINRVYNVALNAQTTLNQLADALKAQMHSSSVCKYAPFRAGDVRHSRADVHQAHKLLGFAATHSFEMGLAAI